ncbi:hypothetical protein C1645_840680 [Glomus cerebriforme]|uniref:Uncharacterized protein n=1 Tax=Glomus cerebriforme TaxID=658196 RepID=A0A397S1R3_9GLOM|nr:hypothetical protein C1645_840680 [Glomus cerebriforme]
MDNFNNSTPDVLSSSKAIMREEENKEKKEEKNERKKEKKKKKKGKRSRGAKSMETHGSTDIFTSAPGSVSKLTVHSRTSPQLQNTSNIDKCIIDDKSQKKKNNSNLLWNISNSPKKEGQKSLGYDLEIRYSDQYMHNRCVNEINELNLPDYICEQLDKNNHLEFHQITKKDSLDFVDDEYIEYLNDTYGITGIQPVFIDHSGYVIWLLDKDGNMYQWCEMQQGLRYMGKDLIDGLTNYFIYPENLCEVMEDTGERIPVEEFKREMKEKAKRIWDNRIILKNINSAKLES